MKIINHGYCESKETKNLSLRAKRSNHVLRDCFGASRLAMTPWIIITVLILVTSAFAAVPHLINYQGRLTDSSGTPLNGSYNITFRMYDAATAGNLLWEETYPAIIIQKGIFNVLLGSVTNLNLLFDKPYFLEIKVGSEVMTPRQQIASAGYAIRAEKAELSETITGILPVSNGGTGTDVNKNTPNGVVVLNDSGYLPAKSVNTVALKTDECQIVHTSPQGFAIYSVTGGEYCFYPQVRMGGTGSESWRCNILDNQSAISGWTSYGTYVTLSTGSTGVAMYVKFRYITNSGIDYWLWFLVDKMNRKILAASSAPDHPSYGNGGDPKTQPQPFVNYDPKTQEIILIEKTMAKAIQNKAKEKNISVIELIEKEYKIDFSQTYDYVPMHSGQFLETKPTLIQSIPSYIKIRKLVKISEKERLAKEQEKKN